MMMRPYAGSADHPGLAAVRSAAAAVDGELWLPGPDTDEGSADACWIAEHNGVIIAFSWLVRTIEADGTEVFLIPGAVDPAYRGLGIGSAMLWQQEAYAQTLAAFEPPTSPGPRVLAGDAGDAHSDGQQLLRDNGYEDSGLTPRFRKPLGPPV